ncbi:MAG: GIY-YIG nuclease family protein [bacterium]|nr:GIY-YIG nuclease family protein [bacterium]
MFYVYVLKSKKDNKLYIGYTKDLKKRIQEHNTGKNFSTAQRGPFSLVYYEAFKSQKDATTREKQLKQFKSTYGHLKKRIANSLHEF